MPKSLEHGPIVLDTSIKNSLNELLSNEKMKMVLDLEWIIRVSKTDDYVFLFRFFKPIFEFKRFDRPSQCLMQVTLQKIYLEFKKDDENENDVKIE